MTYRLISASADTYITDKYVANSRSLNSNVGQAGTLDMFKLFNETDGTSDPGNTVELSRVLIKFDYSPLTNLDASSPTFTASIVLKDVYGGQTVPSNYTLVAFPLSKSFDEGRGFDVASYRDIDTANFLSASAGEIWNASGASDLGNLGADVDVIVSGDIGNGLENLGASMTFARGDEDGTFNITPIVSASLAGLLTNNGFRISFIESQETDGVTRFVKRFGSRHTLDKNLQPKLHVKIADNLMDTTGIPQFNVSQSFFVYNNINGSNTAFVSGANQIVGDDSLIFELLSSKSVSFVTSSWQANFSASITHTTTSVVYFSRSFSGSQYNTEAGHYTTNFNLDLTETELGSFVGTRDSVSFHGLWKSLDGNVTFSKSDFKFLRPVGGFDNAEAKNYVVNIINLKNSYTVDDQVRMNVFVQDRSRPVTVSRTSGGITPVILQNMRWRLIKAYQPSDVVIPYSDATVMSTDRNGMYFDLHMQDLDVNEVYEVEFLIQNDVGKDVVVNNQGFVFKVVV